MGTHTTMTVRRGGNAQNNITPFAVQIDDMSQDEASSYGGAGPYFRYAVYVKVPNTLTEGDIQDRDLLVDTSSIDSVTGILKQYRVISDPQRFSDGHWELDAERYRGT